MLEELQQYENDITDVLDILDADDILDVLQDIIDGEVTFEDIEEDLGRLVKEVPIFLQKLQKSLKTLTNSGSAPQINSPTIIKKSDIAPTQQQ